VSGGFNPQPDPPGRVALLPAVLPSPKLIIGG